MSDINIESVNNKKQMTYGEHLQELRGNLFRILIILIIISISAFIAKNILFEKLILAPFNPEFVTNKLFNNLSILFNNEKLKINVSELKVINIDLAGQFQAHILASIFIAFVLSFPYFIYEIWRFVSPALTINEKKSAKGFILFTSSMFFVGSAFAYFTILPLTINFFRNYIIDNSINNMFSLSDYISNFINICLAGGIIFQFPVLILYLSKMKLINSSILTKNRKIVIVLIFIIAAIITPPDVVSQILVAIPLLLVFEISILISKRIEQ